jgi:heme/copper-type cytochrome/quinol oxidase subunit 3
MKLDYTLFNLLKKRSQRLAGMFYLVPNSPFPFLISINIFFILYGLVNTLHGFTYFGNCLSYFGFFFLLIIALHWWYLLILESQKHFHTYIVQDGFKIAMLIFIISEIMFFFGFFWSFFHSSLAPSFAIGGVWPPKYLITLNPWTFPLLNTLILLSSGATVTWAHQGLLCHKQDIKIISVANDMSRTNWVKYCIQANTFTFKLNYLVKDLKRFETLAFWRKNPPQFLEPYQQYSNPDKNSVRDDDYGVLDIFLSLTLTIILALIFTFIQNYEYQITSFSIESIYGSVFFLLTGFHGIHVLCGTLFLVSFLVRFYLNHYETSFSAAATFLHFELASWYWHFVDIVWICLFIFLYWWGGA